jgi:hypothetical protein
MCEFRPLTLLFLVFSGFFTSAYAATDIVAPESTNPTDLPVMVPGKSETADSAFAKLDIGKKGYLTQQDTNVLDDFDQAFKAADEDRDKRLTPNEFIHGWASYTGIPSDPEIFQRSK